MEAKKHRFFKVTFDATTSAIFDCKTLISEKEARERCAKFYGQKPKTCVYVPSYYVIDSLKEGMILMEMSLNENCGFVIGKVLDPKIQS